MDEAEESAAFVEDARHVVARHTTFWSSLWRACERRRVLIAMVMVSCLLALAVSGGGTSSFKTQEEPEGDLEKDESGDDDGPVGWNSNPTEANEDSEVPAIDENEGITTDDAYLLEYFHTRENLDIWEADCNRRYKMYAKDPRMLRLVEADCGGGYKLPTPEDNQRRWKVALVGGWSDLIRELSGCELGYSCPLSPKCEFIDASSNRAVHANVYNVAGFSYHSYKDYKRDPDSISVLYWREALWDHLPNMRQQLSDFDLEMGVHYFAALNNPSFLHPPSFLAKGVFQNVPKKFMAASVISDCETKSLREVYIKELNSYLGAHRLHRFGECTTHSFPKKPMWRGFKILSQYKFYLSFENTIQTGYSTEKLFDILMMRVVPVYYGDPNAPNITKTPSYIKVSDFPNPKALAHYLIYLDEHPEEYEKYHSWRNNVASFDDEYIDRVRHLPGPTERKAHPLELVWRSYRKAQCCRLCNGAYLRQRMKERGGHIVNGTMDKDDIKKRFYK